MDARLQQEYWSMKAIVFTQVNQWKNNISILLDFNIRLYDQIVCLLSSSVASAQSAMQRDP